MQFYSSSFLSAKKQHLIGHWEMFPLCISHLCLLWISLTLHGAVTISQCMHKHLLVGAHKLMSHLRLPSVSFFSPQGLHPGQWKPSHMECNQIWRRPLHVCGKKPIRGGKQHRKRHSQRYFLYSSFYFITGSFVAQLPPTLTLIALNNFSNACIFFF